MREKEELTFDMASMQFTGLLFGLLLVAVLLLPYYLLYGMEALGRINDFFSLRIFIPSALIGILVHEFVHGYTWSRAANIGWKNIKFGFQLKTFTPYAHCTVPMRVKAYRIGAMMPFILLGLLPYFIALWVQAPLMLGFGLFFSFAAIGDIMIWWRIRHLPSTQLVQDHPTKAGVILWDDAE